jgi:hypothetical protein
VIARTDRRRFQVYLLSVGFGKLWLAVVALLVLQGCTKTVYYAVLAPHQAMADQDGCFRQCQMIHAGQTKQLVKCVETCPGSRVVKERRCNDVEFDAQEYGCTTVHNQALDGVALGLGIGFLLLLNVLVVAFAVANNNAQSMP